MEKIIILKVHIQITNLPYFHVYWGTLDENQFRHMVVWLEDMKIRLYPIDERQNLRDTQTPQWEQVLSKVNSLIP